MGKLIICSGKQTLKPYYFKLTNTKIYSIEELCYYIYNNIDVMNEEFFGDLLVTWMSTELQLEESANKLQELLNVDAGLKDLVVCILCSADYYTEMEIKQLLQTMDEMARLTPIEKKKNKANNYLKYRQFTEAATEYENILNGKDVANLTGEEYGDLVHNLAVVQLNTVGIAVAADSFKEAYERNHNAESLKQYLYSLKMSKQEERFLQECLAYEVSQKSQEQIQNEIELKFMEAETSDEYKVVNNLKECKQVGKMSQYYKMAEELIGQWKQEFRRENS